MLVVLGPSGTAASANSSLASRLSVILGESPMGLFASASTYLGVEALDESPFACVGASLNSRVADPIASTNLGTVGATADPPSDDLPDDDFGAPGGLLYATSGELSSSAELSSSSAVAHPKSRDWSVSPVCEAAGCCEVVLFLCPACREAAGGEAPEAAEVEVDSQGGNRRGLWNAKEGVEVESSVPTLPPLAL